MNLMKIKVMESEKRKLIVTKIHKTFYSLTNRNLLVSYPLVLKIILNGQIKTQTQFDITAKKHDTSVNDHEIMGLFLLILFISTCNAFQAQDQGLLLQEKK